jgi:ubiquinone/menaquinone biosynthesis C-methylase UbiE
VCPVEHAKNLDNVLRKLVQNPKKIFGKYIKEGMVVLDVGCGPGFFSIEIAKMVGESGRVIAADLQEGMLEKVKNKVRGKDIEERIELHKCEEDTIGISTKLDFVLAFYVVHEVVDQEKFLEEIGALLKPNGMFFIVEPIFHVSKQAFEETIYKANVLGFKPIEKPRVFFSRAAVLRKDISNL